MLYTKKRIRIDIIQHHALFLTLLRATLFNLGRFEKAQNARTIEHHNKAFYRNNIQLMNMLSLLETKYLVLSYIFFGKLAIVLGSLVRRPIVSCRQFIFSICLVIIFQAPSIMLYVNCCNCCSFS